MAPRAALALMTFVAAVAVVAARAGQAGFSIQLFPFSVPVIGDDGQRVTASVATYLDVHGEKEANTVCTLAPRIRDAVNQVLFADPIRRVGRKMELAGIDGRVHQAITAAIKSDLVLAVHVVSGAKQEDAAIGHNTVLGCRLGKSGKVEVKKQERRINDVFRKYR